MPKPKTKGTPLDMEALAEAFKALSNKNRLSIFEQIRQAAGRRNLTATTGLPYVRLRALSVLPRPPSRTISRNSGGPTWSAARGRANQSSEQRMKRPSVRWSDTSPARTNPDRDQAT